MEHEADLTKCWIRGTRECGGIIYTPHKYLCVVNVTSRRMSSVNALRKGHIVQFSHVDHSFIHSILLY